MVEKHSKAREIASYSFLVVFANDSIIDANELHFIEKLALEDNQIDEEEKLVLRNIFSRVSDDELAPEVVEEIKQFRKKYDI